MGSYIVSIFALVLLLIVLVIINIILNSVIVYRVSKSKCRCKRVK